MSHSVQENCHRPPFFCLFLHLCLCFLLSLPVSLCESICFYVCLSVSFPQLISVRVFRFLRQNVYIIIFERVIWLKENVFLTMKISLTPMRFSYLPTCSFAVSNKFNAAIFFSYLFKKTSLFFFPDLLCTVCYRRKDY